MEHGALCKAETGSLCLRPGTRDSKLRLTESVQIEFKYSNSFCKIDTMWIYMVPFLHSKVRLMLLKKKKYAAMKAINPAAWMSSKTLASITEEFLVPNEFADSSAAGGRLAEANL